VIHLTAIVADDASIGDEVEIGAFCVVGLDGPADAAPTRLGAGSIVRSHTVIYRGVDIGERAHLGHGALVRHGTRLGAGCSVGSATILEHDVVIEPGARLHSRCFVPEHSVIGSDAWVGPGVIVTNARYPNRPETKDELEGVTVEPRAVVGAGAVLLPGVRIGEGALVGAGAVVVRDVEKGATVVGNPAREIDP
jgi:acetyltransferase-like isoleucine patch superfamily enzyme